MFRKTTRRNIRERKDDSSEDEKKDDEENSEMQCLQIKPKPQNRGITCSSKPRKSPSKSDSSEDEKDEIDEKTSRVGLPGPAAGNIFGKSKQKVFSFSDDNDGAGAESEFKVRKNKDKLVVFNAPKKEDLPDITEAKEVPQRKQAMAESESDTMQDEKDESDDSDVSSLTTRSSHSSRSSVPATSIPSAQRIHAAKEARKQARAPRDYIPLEGYREGTPGTGDEEEEEEGRDDSVEQDSDNELDDHEHRIDFAPKPRTLKERMAEEMGHSDSEDSSMDSDGAEAQSLWEAQQVEKGVKRPQLSRNECVVLSDLLQNILQISSSKQSEKRRKRMRIPKSLPAVSYSIIKKRITGKLESLRGVHRAHEADLRRLQFDMDEAKSSLENMEKTAAEEQLKFYRNMRVYADNLVECLTEKTVLINSVEMDMHSLYIDQAEALFTRRRELVRGESTRLQQLTFNVGNQASEESAEALNGSQNSEAIQKALELGSPPEDEKADPEQETDLQQKRVDILGKAKDIFSDVQADFSDISKILSRFDEWRRSFADSYNNAYIGLCLPKLLGPIVRQQLIGWNPLLSDGEDFEALPWYSAVEKFCHGQGHEQSDNADEKTIPAIIEKTILPKVQGFVELVWDPLSLSHTRSLTVLCKRLEDDYSIFSGDQSKPVKAFLASVTSRLRSAVDEDVFIPLFPKKYLDDQSSPQCKFHAQQFWSAVKLLGNMSLWDELLPEHTLKELMLDKLLNRYLMMTLLNESNVLLSVNKSKKVAACFPKSWFGQLDTRTSLPQLKNFCSHLLQTGHLVCKDTANPDRTRDILRTLFLIMADIKAWDDLTTIAEKYHHTDLLNQLF